ncbi:MAG: lamin tail domain-containing protein [Candidatus Saccharimonadales bacterium]
MRLFKWTWLVVISLIWLLPASAWAEDNQDNDWIFSEDSPVLISEIQTRGTVTEDNESTTFGTHEFIELYNTTDEDISLDGWRIEFINQSGSKNRIVAEFVDNPDEDIEYVIATDGFFVISHEEYLEESDYLITSRLNLGHLNYNDGTVVLFNSDDEVVDMLGYGDPEHYLGSAALSLNKDQSLRRCFDADGDIVNEGNNGEDFAISDQPRPGDRYDCLKPEEDDDDSSNDENGEDEGDEIDDENNNGDNDNSDSDDNGLDNDHHLYCEGVVLSELLPNPEGPRSQFPREEHAFIEIFNRTNEPIDLEGCGLQIMYVNSGNMSDIFWFDENLTIEPFEFMVFFEQDSDLALPVGVSGKVYLLTANDIELDEIELDESSLDNSLYEEPIPEGASWALFTDEEDYWQWTYSPTPGEINIEQGTKPLPDCEPGRERNPETGRCRNIIQEEPPPDCGPGRERNPETNRCRNIASASSSTLVPCQPHQERNPETNRCRNIESSSSLVPCGPNQERNPETNRCRNITLPNEEAISDIQDVRAAYVAAPISWWFSGGLFLLALGYGVWEWRRDISNLLRRLRKT